MDYSVYISSNAFAHSQIPGDIGMYEVHEGDHAWVEADIRNSDLAQNIDVGSDPRSSYEWAMKRIVQLENHAYDAALNAAGSLNASPYTHDYLESVKSRVPSIENLWGFGEPPMDPSLWGNPYYP